ncbi:hypothetical protein ACHAXS_005899 [Conticribra weissflogii]
MSQQYGNIDYWDARYNEDKEPFEWYQRYSGFRHFLTPEYLCLSPVDSETVNYSTPEKISESEEKRSSSMPDQSRRQSINNNSGKSKSHFPAAKDTRVLIIGCGNSEVGEEMLSDGFTNHICNVDFSSVVIRQMNAKYSDEWYQRFDTRLRRERKLEGSSERCNGQNGDGPSTPKWILAKKASSGTRSNRHIDATDADSHKRSQYSNGSKANNKSTKLMMNKMLFQCFDVTKPFPYTDQSYDLIVCKGTFDAILCASKRLEKVRIMMKECHRVLDENHGVMLIVSYGDPEKRLGCFDSEKWKEIKTFTVPKPLVPATVSENNPGGEHFVYILYK